MIHYLISNHRAGRNIIWTAERQKCLETLSEDWERRWYWITDQSLMHEWIIISFVIQYRLRNSTHHVLGMRLVVLYSTSASFVLWRLECQRQLLTRNKGWSVFVIISVLQRLTLTSLADNASLAIWCMASPTQATARSIHTQLFTIPQAVAAVSNGSTDLRRRERAVTARFDGRLQRRKTGETGKWLSVRTTPVKYDMTTVRHESERRKFFY